MRETRNPHADLKKLRKIAKELKKFCDRHGCSINATAFGTASGIALPHTDNKFYSGNFVDFDYAPGGTLKLNGEEVA